MVAAWRDGRRLFEHVRLEMKERASLTDAYAFLTWRKLRVSRKKSNQQPV